MKLRTVSIALSTTIISVCFVAQTYAQTASSSPLMISPSVLTVATQSGYILPFPGVLPDSPLYVFKTIRDRLVSFFISDPLKRSSFDLLQSDKRMNAVVFLTSVPKPDTALTITTISKALNYYEEGTSELRTARKIGESVTEMKKEYLNAAGKYDEVVQTLEQSATGGYSNDLSTNEKRLLDLEKQVTLIKEK